MNVLIIGGGGREHALAWQASKNRGVHKIFVAPGNAGTALEKKTENVPLDVMDIDGLLTFAKDNNVDLTIVGPEAPLVAGIVDLFQAANMDIFGPTKGAAQLEGSKAFAKDFLQRHGIPTASYATFTEVAPALAYINEQGAPIVIKADGLAAGKGVILADTIEQACAAVEDMLAGNAFGEAGNRVVIEEFLVGEEASFIVMADGKNVLPLASSQDHKARDEGDLGPNTGGMGAYSPAPVVDATLHQRIMDEVIMPTVNGMAADGYVYTGFLYAGIMVDSDGTPKVLEFNCRFGDPETQPIMMRLKNSIVELCVAGTMGVLDQTIAHWDSRPAIGVVLAAKGYPDAYPKGDVISLPEELGQTSKIFHAGTTLNDEGMVTTNGGRVLCAVALGDTVGEAQHKAYELADQITWEGKFCRRDIGYRAIAREQLH
ncbi:MAG: phosphoribosylamine--glycine ligase [Gammaproteobacteria bacterium]|jgi:phosphoribosylamine--glycine ligase|nr:MAG: Phosphoribosylamine--glycine ligase [Oceanospirillaceae bacterium UBA2001]|tara:strand:- start:527 stop:1816 length:1290 start_codon:yes stop_codon:yes gene_type:complete